MCGLLSICALLVSLSLLLSMPFELTVYTSHDHAFRALKKKHNTPKYGLLYHASLVGQSTPKNKGKVRPGEQLFLFVVLFVD